MSEIRNLIKDYGDFKIDIPRWSLADQGVTALWGPSGSGKTSCFRLLLGLEPCPGLTWNFQGEDLAQLPVGKRRLGVVFQSLELFPHMSAAENIRFAARARGIKGWEATLEKLSIRLKIDRVLARSVKILSGGEQQRVALARALIGEPRFLFLDEPFSSLDADLKQEARALVKDTITSFGIPTLLITHDYEDIKILAEHVVRIENGRILNG